MISSQLLTDYYQKQRKKKADEDLVLHFFAVSDYRQQFRGNIEEWLDDFLEAILFKRVLFDIEENRKHFLKIFELLKAKFSSSAFTRFNDQGMPTGRLAPAYFEAVVASVNQGYDVLKEIEPSILLHRLQLAFSDENFRNATGPGANTKEKLEARIAIVSNYLTGDEYGMK